VADFTPICTWVLKQEDSTLSGVVKNLGDGQGLTRFGVGQKSHPELGGIFFTMPAPGALSIAEGVYRDTYWNRFQGDNILDDGVASCLLSFAINDGTSREVRMLQKGLGLTVDGAFGPQTLAATNAAAPQPLAAALRSAQAAFYEELALTRADIAAVLPGLLARARRVYPSLT
jgi:lysozyme family protein